MVHVTLLMEGISLVYCEPGESIVLQLGCRSVEILLRVRQMILSGLLLRDLSDVIKQFVQRQCQVQLVVQQEDYNMCLSCLSIAAGTNKKALHFSVIYENCFSLHTLKLISCDCLLS